MALFDIFAHLDPKLHQTGLFREKWHGKSRKITYDQMGLSRPPWSDVTFLYTLFFFLCICALREAFFVMCWGNYHKMAKNAQKWCETRQIAQKNDWKLPKTTKVDISLPDCDKQPKFATSWPKMAKNCQK